jgi:hypothetical protein
VQNYYTIQEKECSVLALLLLPSLRLLRSRRRRFPASSSVPLVFLSDPSPVLVGFRPLHYKNRACVEVFIAVTLLTLIANF